MGFRRRNYEFEADLYKVPTPWLFRREMEGSNDGDAIPDLEVGQEVESRLLGMSCSQESSSSTDARSAPAAAAGSFHLQAKRCEPTAKSSSASGPK